MGFRRKTGGGGGVWRLLLLAGVMLAVAAAATGGMEEDRTTTATSTTTMPDAVGFHNDCIDICYEKFLDGGDDETEDELWKCIGDCPANLQGTAGAVRRATDAARTIRHAATATKPDAVVGFPSCIGICYERFDGKSEEDLEKCIDKCTELNHGVVRAIRQVV